MNGDIFYKLANAIANTHRERGDRPDMILIGAGPSAVASARALVDSGRDFLWLEAGSETTLPLRDRLDATGAGPALTDLMVGSHPAFGSAEESPKLRAPALASLMAGYDADPVGDGESFRSVGLYGTGGLSNAWGTMVRSYSADDLGAGDGEWPDYEASYRSMADMIGISGPAGQDGDDPILRTLPGLMAPLPVDAPAGHVLGQRAPKTGAQLYRPYQAVLTAAHAGRPGCDRRLACLWGCDRGSAWSARFEVARLKQSPHADFRPHHRVVGIAKTPSGYTVRAEVDSGSIVSFETERVILAAGTIQSTALALDCAGHEGDVPLLTTPSFAAAYYVLPAFGRTARRSGYSMAQISWNEPGDAGGSGALYTTDGLPLSELAIHFPLSRRGSWRLGTLLAPAILVSNGFLPSEWSRNRAALSRNQRAPRLRIAGAHAADADARARQAQTALSRTLRSRHTYELPMSFKVGRPGTDIHYGGTLPRACARTAGLPLTTDGLGQLPGLSGLHVVDGSVLPRLTAHHPTLSMMANAHRITRQLA
ncbi:MAG TPA: hypothetical protein DCQ53_07235 [Alphaproteobacteria bacterium]|nr:hypothetical protein [Alphaproteobacteria bacterium]